MQMLGGESWKKQWVSDLRRGLLILKAGHSVSDDRRESGSLCSLKVGPRVTPHAPFWLNRMQILRSNKVTAQIVVVAC